MDTKNLLLGPGFRVAISHRKNLLACWHQISKRVGRPWRGSRLDLENELCIWDTQTWTLKAQVALDMSPEVCFGYGSQEGIQFSPDDQSVLIFDHVRYQLLELSSGKLGRKFQTGGRTSPVRFSPCGQFLILAVENHLGICRAATGELIERHDLAENLDVVDIASSADGRCLAFLAQSRPLSDAETLEDKVLLQALPVKHLSPTEVPVKCGGDLFSLDLAPDASCLAACTADSVEIFSCKTFQHLGAIKASGTLPTVCWAPSGHLVYTDGDVVCVVDRGLRHVEEFVTTDENRMPQEGRAPVWASLLKYWEQAT